MSNITGDSGSFSSGNTAGEPAAQEVVQHFQQLQNHLIHGSNSSTRSANSNTSSTSLQQQPPIKKKRSLPGTPDPSAEVIALSPTTLMATNRFVCEICNKGFQRDQNLQLHRRGHNLPWKLKQRSSTEIRKRVYICPEPTCVHHNPARALGDLTGIKKHFCRKHGEKKWKCDKCSKKYAVQSDWKAHSKTCGTREYKCDCGTIFSRRDSFITHRAFCDALAEENNKVNQGLMATMEAGKLQGQVVELMSSMPVNDTSPGGEFSETDAKNPLKSLPQDLMVMPLKPLTMTGGMFSSSSGTLFNGPRSNISSASSCLQLSANSLSNFDGLDDGKIGRQLAGSAHMSATALLQKAAQMGATASSNINSPMMQKSFVSGMAGLDQFNGIRSSSPYGGINQQDNNNNNNNNNSSLDYMQSQTDQSQVDGMINNGGGFINQFLHKGLSSQEMSSQFIDPTTPGTTDSSSSGMNNMAMFTGLFMGGDQQHGFLKNMEQHDHQNSSSTTASMSSPGRTTVNSSGLGIAGSGRSPIGLSRFGENNNGDMMTVDFLGVGGISRSANLNEQQQQQQRMDQLEAISQQRLHSFQVQELLNSQAMDKPMWDV